MTVSLYKEIQETDSFLLIISMYVKLTEIHLYIAFSLVVDTVFDISNIFYLLTFIEKNYSTLRTFRTIVRSKQHALINKDLPCSKCYSSCSIHC